MGFFVSAADCGNTFNKSMMTYCFLYINLYYPRYAVIAPLSFPQALGFVASEAPACCCRSVHVSAVALVCSILCLCLLGGDGLRPNQTITLQKMGEGYRSGEGDGVPGGVTPCDANTARRTFGFWRGRPSAAALP